ncbi:MAG: hypothetical protein LUQ50_02305 [Methanospirillum sp.]|uniref:hypothetical protein n=1 Tax=Methanospirillum sp. TaxID=45200 RepID=UPI00236F4AF2|nr:hypothetical protein [Methanospirillum sp.]MDD1727886.1 hypothetical protein [Methanospirillum sp.]
MNDSIRTLLYGILTWLIPFLIALPCYSSDGVILIDQQVFKSIMIVTGSLTGAILLVHLFRVMRWRYFQAGWLIGISWLAINLTLDFIILIPMSNLDIPSYFTQIGMRYLSIPIMSVMAGVVADHAVQSRA